MDSTLRMKAAAIKNRCNEKGMTKWIQRFILILIPCSLLLTPSCKQNNWLDWKTQNELWLEENKELPDIKTTSTGLQYRIIADPTPNDARPNSTSTIICDYTVKLINGYQVDGGNYVSMNLNSTIPGFTEGCHLIHNNGDIELYIPSKLGYDNQNYTAGTEYDAEGYGTEGTQSYIPPYSTLIFTVHLCGVSGD